MRFLSFDRYVAFLDKFLILLETNHPVSLQLGSISTDLENMIYLQLKAWGHIPFWTEDHCLGLKGNEMSEDREILQAFIRFEIMKERFGVDQHFDFDQWMSKVSTHPLYPQWELFKNNIKKHILQQSSADTLIDHIENAISDKVVILIEQANDEKRLLVPLKLIQMEKDICLVGEDSFNHCLQSIEISNIKNFTIQDHKEYKSIFSSHEVDEFIHALFQMDSMEERLILKLRNINVINHFPEHQHLGKACMVTNPMGDIIWGAYVIPNEEIYQWLAQYKDHFEVLNPEYFRIEFEKYCDEKIRRPA